MKASAAGLVVGAVAPSDVVPAVVAAAVVAAAVVLGEPVVGEPVVAELVDGDVTVKHSLASTAPVVLSLAAE